VILCSGDSSLALLAEAAQQLPEDYPSLRLANPMQVQNHASVDLYVDEVLRHAKVILISLHGGIGYWRYGVERLVELAERGVQLILVPGMTARTRNSAPQHRGRRGPRPPLAVLRQGGMGNALGFFAAWPAAGWAATTPGPSHKPCRARRSTTHKSPAQLSDWQAEWRPINRWRRCCSTARTCRRRTPLSSTCSVSVCRRRG
jgi:cobaltochelatase CobN